MYRLVKPCSSMSSWSLLVVSAVPSSKLKDEICVESIFFNVCTILTRLPFCWTIDRIKDLINNFIPVKAFNFYDEDCNLNKKAKQKKADVFNSCPATRLTARFHSERGHHKCQDEIHLAPKTVLVSRERQPHIRSDSDGHGSSVL